MRLVDETFHALRRKLCLFVLPPRRHLAGDGGVVSVCPQGAAACLAACLVGIKVELELELEQQLHAAKKLFGFGWRVCCVNFCTPSISSNLAVDVGVGVASKGRQQRRWTGGGSPRC